MEFKDGIKLKGHVNLKVYRGGKLVEERDDHNLIHTDGLATLPGYLVTGAGAFSSKYEWQGIGTGTGAVVGDNILVAEVNPSTGAAATEHTATAAGTTSAGKAVIIGTFSIGTTLGLNEVGLFSQLAVAGHKMLARQQFASVLNLVANDTLVVTWAITFS